LLVDEDLLVARLIGILLKGHAVLYAGGAMCLDVEEARSFDRAMELVGNHNYDAVLIDRRMDGDLERAMRESGHNVPIGILYSGENGVAPEFEHRLLREPFCRDEFISFLLRLLGPAL